MRIPVTEPESIYCNRDSAEGCVHRPCRRIAHSREDVAAGVEGDRYGGVPEELLDDLGVNSSREERRSAGVPEVVEPDPGPPCLLKQNVYDKLFNTFGLWRERPHELQGLRSRLAARVTLHNFCIWLNEQLGRPRLALTDLLGW